MKRLVVALAGAALLLGGCTDEWPHEQAPTPPVTTPAEPTTPAPSPTPDPTEPQEPTPDPTPDPTPTEPQEPPQSFPGPQNTGVPAVTVLRPSAGLTVTQDGAVVEDLHIRGGLVINADNVLVRRVLVDYTGSRYAINQSGGTGLVVEDSTIDGNGGATIAVMSKRSYTLRRVEIHSVQDGPRIEADDVTIEHSWVHSLTRVPGGHHDAVQMRDGKRAVIRGNTLDAYNAETRDPMNAAFQMGSQLDANRTVSVTLVGNYLNGGTYAMRGGSVKAPDPEWVVDSTARGNVFGPDSTSGAVQGLAPGWDWDDTNVWRLTGLPVRP